MEQSPIRQASFHIRILNLLALLLIIDIAMANHALHVTLTKGPSMMIMFGFEVKIEQKESNVGKLMLQYSIPS